MRRIALALIAGTVMSIVPITAEAGNRVCARETTDARAATVLLFDNCFGPTVARISPGDTVTFENRDAVPHTVTGAHLSWGSTQDLVSGASITATFDETGVYPYSCILHPGMIGAVIVGDAATTASPSNAGASAAPSASSLPLAAVAGLILILGAAAVAIGRRTQGLRD